MPRRKNWVRRRLERINGSALARRVIVLGARALFRPRTRKVIMPGIQLSIGAVSAAQLAVAAVPAMQLASALAIWWNRVLVPSPEFRPDKRRSGLREVVGDIRTP